MNKPVTVLGTLMLVLMMNSPVFAAERKTTIKVYGMGCQMCANGVAASLRALKGVTMASVSVEEGRAVVVYDDRQVTLAQIEKQVENSGYSTKPDGPLSKPHCEPRR